MPSKRKSAASDAQTPSKRAATAAPEPSSSKKRKAAEAEREPKSASKKRAQHKVEVAPAPSTANIPAPATSTPSKKAAATKSVPKSAIKVSQSPVRVSVTIVESLSPTKPVVAVALPKRAVRAAAKQPIAAQLETGIDETVSLWRHVRRSLGVATATVGPLFLAVIFVCYALSAYEQAKNNGKGAQLVASVGVLFFIVYLAIICAFAVLLAPCILLTKVFGMFVGNEGDKAFLGSHSFELYSLCFLGGAATAYTIAARYE